MSTIAIPLPGTRPDVERARRLVAACESQASPSNPLILPPNLFYEYQKAKRLLEVAKRMGTDNWTEIPLRPPLKTDTH